MKRIVVVAALVVAALAAPAAVAQGPTLAETDRLDDRRYVVTGPRAYAVGTQAGRFPAMGFHTRGEMGGIWSPPIKLLDGVWFGLDGEWIGPATRFESGFGHVRMALPGRPGLTAERIDFVPGERRGVLVGLRLTSTSSAAQQVTLRVHAHSELMSIYPWGETKPYDQRTFNLQDTVAVRGDALVFREQGRPAPEAPEHDWATAVGTARTPTATATGPAFRGPQDPPVVCPESGTGTPPLPPRCDESAYGRGAGGELTYTVDVPAGGTASVWLGVAGSEAGEAGALGELDRMLAAPDAALREKVAERQALARWSRFDLPGDPLLAQGLEWSKQNLADSVQEARDLEIRETNAGKNYPPPEGTLDRIRFLGAGFPDYPWLFATDGEYTAFASVALGQFEPIEEHLRALRRASLIDNGTSGKVVHEVITDGSVYFGSNADPGNTDETAKFPSAVALVWRWTGDRGFLEENYDFARSNMEYIFRELDADGDLWPEGLGNVERPGMGEEKLDNTVYTIRGLRDLADLARAMGDRPTVERSEARAAAMERRFDPTWWMPEIPQHADSLGEGNTRIQQRHWIGSTPMEVELLRRGVPVPGLTTYERGRAALELRGEPCYGDAFGMFHTGAPGCDPAQSDRPAERQTFTLNTSIIAVAEGNYGRLGVDQQRRWTTANRRLQLPDPDEQPGAMPEIAPSPDYGRSIDKHFAERAQVLQAWGNYGTAWPVVHQQLGVRPDLGRDRLEVTPQVPPGSPSIAGRRIRLGEEGHVAVTATHTGDRYVTTVGTASAPIDRLTIGHTLPRDAVVRSVRLDGEAVDWRTRRTNRGLEVLVTTRPAGTLRLEVRAG